jgi:carboxyl-terminal processing protease
MRQSPARAAAHALAIALLAVSCCGVGSYATTLGQERAAAGQTQRDDFGIDRAKLFDAVVDTVDKEFFDEAILRQIDWRSRAQAVRPSVLSAATAEEAVRRINGLLSELKTSHTALFTPDDYEYYILLDILGAPSNQSDLISRRFWGNGPYYPGIGVFTRKVEGRHFIEGTMEGSPADRAGLRFGDEVLSVDGQPYTPIAAFRDKLGRTVDIELRRDASAQPERLPVSVIPILPTKAFSAATAASARVIERHGSRVGYIHVWALHEATTANTALRRLIAGGSSGDRLPAARRNDGGKETDKLLDFLIVDMRGRVGGNVAIAQQYLEMLDARKSYFGESRTITRSRSPQALASPRAQAIFTRMRETSALFQGRSALLIDHRTRSAGELMAYGYKRSGLGPVLGTPTAGALSSGGLFVMPGDLLLYVAVSGHELNGQRIEGVGVSPDHRVERSLPYANGADPVLDAAIELLAKKASE